MRRSIKPKAPLVFAIVLSLCFLIVMPVVEGATKVELEAPDKGAKWVQLSWSRSQDDGDFSKYEVYVDRGEGFSLNATITDIDKTNYKVTGLTSDTEYRFKIRDIDTALNEEDSDVLTVETKEIPWIPGFEVVSFILAILIVVLSIGIYRRYYRTQDE